MNTEAGLVPVHVSEHRLFIFWVSPGERALWIPPLWFSLMEKSRDVRGLGMNSFLGLLEVSLILQSGKRTKNEPTHNLTEIDIDHILFHLQQLMNNRSNMTEILHVSVRPVTYGGTGRCGY